MWWQMCSKDHVVHCELLDIVALQDFWNVLHVFFWLEIFWRHDQHHVEYARFLNSKSIVQNFSTSNGHKHMKLLDIVKKIPTNAYIFQFLWSNVTTFLPLIPLQNYYKILHLKFQKKYFMENFDECSSKGSF